MAFAFFRSPIPKPDTPCGEFVQKLFKLSKKQQKVTAGSCFFFLGEGSVQNIFKLWMTQLPQMPLVSFLGSVRGEKEFSQTNLVYVNLRGFFCICSEVGFQRFIDGEQNERTDRVTVKKTGLLYACHVKKMRKMESNSAFGVSPLLALRIRLWGPREENRWTFTSREAACWVSAII